MPSPFAPLAHSFYGNLKGVLITGIHEKPPLNKVGRGPLMVQTIVNLLIFRYIPMLRGLQDATRASVRFARRHRRAIVFGGVVGATAYAYHMMRTAVKKVPFEIRLVQRFVPVGP